MKSNETSNLNRKILIKSEGQGVVRRLFRIFRSRLRKDRVERARDKNDRDEYLGNNKRVKRNQRRI